jgi:uncharacterized membrane protein (UPF0127 family)
VVKQQIFAAEGAEIAEKPISSLRGLGVLCGEFPQVKVHIMSFERLRSITLLLMLSGLVIGVIGGGETTQAAEGSKPLSTMPVTLGPKTVTASIANEDWSRVEGLLKWDTIADDQGMLLDFVIPAEYAIHMQGMKFPIDAVWIDANGLVKLIHENIQPDSGQIYASYFPCRYCLELKAGFCKRYGVRIGQTVVFGAPAK